MFDKTFIIAEIGINHNGDYSIALELIKKAYMAGFDAVKFQKRNPENYPEKPYNSPLFGEVSYREHKRRLEFGKEEYEGLFHWCNAGPIECFTSCFDKESIDFIAQFKPNYWKIPSPAITNIELIEYFAKQPGKILMSTGMSDLLEVDKAVSVLLDRGRRNDVLIMHCCSEYPTPLNHVNLRNISMLAERYELPVGYSSHDAGVAPSVAAVALGASAIEVHITLDRAMKGSDHAASLEFEEMERLCRHIRGVEKALGSYGKQFYPGEKAIRNKVAQIGKKA